MYINDIKTDDYYYQLSDDRIAKVPLEQRDQSKLLVYQNNVITEDRFFNLAGHIDENSLMVFNNTRVIHARLEFRKVTGSRIEVLCLEPYEPTGYYEMFQKTGECQWWCMVGNLKKWKNGTITMQVSANGIATNLTAEKILNKEDNTLVKFTWDGSITFGELIECAGVIPLPPYLNRQAEPEDNIRYQTVYSKVDGSVAAPTAGLHFTSGVIDSLRIKAIDRAFLTLHVGAGTFKPVKAPSIKDHEMHTEHYIINISVIEKIINKKGKLIAVGTTSVRTIESLYWLGVKISENPAVKIEDLHTGQWEPYNKQSTLTGTDAIMWLYNWMNSNKLTLLQSSTKIIIVPGYKFRLVEAIITNFHQPGSTLLLLISAWIGEDWRRIYNYALENNFRFLSYGDSSLLY